MFYFVNFIANFTKNSSKPQPVENVFTKGDLKCQKTPNLLFTR